ncbi:hypothetical protein E2C01_093810 [Portunus trituberculatus]|uniref:Uncharacterized protein n=1 Tax=Portunus trituberculatus TaxID=210409 RepID=A0A5B7JUH1_PORTR|nr:hypothetical protein [Portunus trituberculatus]
MIGAKEDCERVHYSPQPLLVLGFLYTMAGLLSPYLLRFVRNFSSLGGDQCSSSRCSGGMMWTPDVKGKFLTVLLQELGKLSSVVSAAVTPNNRKWRRTSLVDVVYVYMWRVLVHVRGGRLCGLNEPF